MKKNLKKIFAFALATVTIGVSSVSVNAAPFGVYYTTGAPSYNNCVVDEESVIYDGSGSVGVTVDYYSSTSSSAYLYFTSSSTLKSNTFKQAGNTTYIPIIGTKPLKNSSFQVNARLSGYTGNSVTAYGTIEE